MKKYLLLVSGLVIFCLQLHATVVLPKILSDNMVLQRNVAIPVWGKAAPNEKIEIRFHNQIKTTRANKQGRWTIRLDAETAGGPYELSVKGKNLLLIKNVLVGEVWLCSGQSNMEWTVKQSNNAAGEIASANYPLIRHIKIARDISTMPKEDFKEGEWTICTPATVGDFSGIGYFFARNIFKELNVPVGLINASWGGTNIETWISRQGFEGSSEFKEMIAGMPVVNMDSLSEMRTKAVVQKIEALQGGSLKNANTASFKETSFNDARWPQMNAPLGWEQQSLGELDGVVWLRKTVSVSAAAAGKPATLELAKIDDDDISYVNGIKVGSTRQWDAKRKYNIAAGILKEGDNVIAIQVTDNGGGGGIYGDADNLKLTTADAVIPLTGAWKYQVASVIAQLNVNSFPSLAYNAMVNPLVPYAMQGVLWYQGESNAERAFQYRTAFPLLINDWRKKWNNNFSFYFVQLATFTTAGNSNEGSSWAELREAQTMALQLPATGMAVTTDIGNPSDIHPTNKQEVGHRLAAVALNNLYDKKIISSGPAFQSMVIKNNEAILSFSNTGGGLSTTDKYGYIRGFEIAGKDQAFHYARAIIHNNTIILSSDKVATPVAVRFGWIGDASDNNLFNVEGFPAIPFRTDDWKTVTRKNVYTIEKL